MQILVNLHVLLSNIEPLLGKSYFHRNIMLGSHRGDDIHRFRRRNLVASDSSPKVRRQSIHTTCAHSVLDSLIIFYKNVLLVLVILFKL